MAVVSRRTGTQMITEILLRLARSGDTAFQSRASNFLHDAYLYVCTRWHHHKLAMIEEDTGGFEAGALSYDMSGLSAMPFIISGVQLSASGGGDPKWMLEQKNHRELFAMRPPIGSKRTEGPRYYCRFGDTLHFEAETQADHRITILSQKEPPAWDHDVVSPLDEIWDELLMEKTVSLSYAALLQPDMAALHEQTFMQMASEIGQPLLSSGVLVRSPENDGDDPTGGPRG